MTMKSRTRWRAVRLLFAMATVSAAAFAGRSLQASIVTASDEQDIGIKVGSVAPAAALQRLDGTSVNLSEYIGKQPVLLEFWANWCENCKQLEPQLKTAKEKYGDRMKFVAVAVTLNQSLARVKAYITEHKFPLEVLWDNQGNASDVYEVPATSYVVIIDKAGKVAYGGLGGQQKLDEVIRKVLQ
jgi:thiol-disulfide isomerase/thioredoxin